METLNSYISTLGQVVLLLNVALFWIGPPAFRKYFRYFHYFLLWTLVIQIAAKALWLQSKNNLPLLHLYTVLEFLFLSLYYRAILQLGERQKRTFTYAIGIILLAIVLNSLFWQPLTRFNSNAKTLTQIAYIGYAVYYFFKFHNRANTSFGEAVNAFNSGLLVYYAASLFIFMFSNVFMQLGDSLDVFWVINSTFYLGFQLLIFYILWKTTFRPTRST